MADGALPLITVFTATYNRADTLPRLARSLEAQSLKNFEWVVIDDGSTDGTQGLLRELASAGSLNLRHFLVPNGGKHRAINRGLEIALGSWFYIVDSDDWLPPTALERIACMSSEALGRADCCGIMGLKAEGDGTVVGTGLPDSGGFHDTLELHYNLGIKGDKAEVFRTGILRSQPFPEFEGERFLTEAVVWNRLARDGWKFLVANEIIYNCEYILGGLSSSSLKLRLANPRGTALYYAELCAAGLPWPASLRHGINYFRFAFHRSEGAAEALGGFPGPKALGLATLVLGFLYSRKDRMAGRAAR